jgi:hypothetical protein
VLVEKGYDLELWTVIKDEYRGCKLGPNQNTVMTNGYFLEHIVTDSHGLRDLFNTQYEDIGIVAIGDLYCTPFIKQHF